MESMEIDDDVYINKNLTMEGLIRQDIQRQKQPSRCVSVALGLLCTLLLAGNIGLIVYYKLISRPTSADPTQASYSHGDQPHGSFDALTSERKQLETTLTNLTKEKEQLQQSYNSLTSERKQLETRLTNLTKEKDQLQQSYNSLTSERDEFKVSFNNLKNEKEQLQTGYDTLKQTSDRLQTRYEDLQRNLEGLKTDHNQLTASKERLQTNYSDLQRDNNELQGNFSALKRDKEQLQRRYDTLSVSNNNLQTSYSSLFKDKEQLQTSFNALQREHEQLQTNYSSLAAGRDELQKKVDKVQRHLLCQTGWMKFDTSCYSVSTLKRNWTSSRLDCLKKGADLVAINSRDEQVFVNGLLKPNQNAWIGLTDSLKEGTWMWVDGTPVTTTFWQPGQPNSFNGNQDCGEVVHKSSGVGEWNDDGCFAEQIWICEK